MGLSSTIIYTSELILWFHYLCSQCYAAQHSLRRRRCPQPLGPIFLSVRFLRLVLNKMYHKCLGKDGRGYRWREREKNKLHSKPQFSMLYSVVKNHRTRSSANYILYISFFAYLVWSRLVTMNFYYYFFLTRKSRSLLFTMINSYKNKNSTIQTVFVRLIQKVFLILNCFKLNL